MRFDLAELCCCKRTTTTKHNHEPLKHAKFNVEMKKISHNNTHIVTEFLQRPRSMSDCTEQVVVHDLQYSEHDAAHVTKELQRSFSNPCTHVDQ